MVRLIALTSYTAPLCAPTLRTLRHLGSVIAAALKLSCPSAAGSAVPPPRSALASKRDCHLPCARDRMFCVLRGFRSGYWCQGLHSAVTGVHGRRRHMRQSHSVGPATCQNMTRAVTGRSPVSSEAGTNDRCTAEVLGTEALLRAVDSADKVIANVTAQCFCVLFAPTSFFVFL